jgi:predicted nucleic acid-binding protein
LEGATLHYSHQNIAELWNAMTRPVARNGFGLTAAEAEREVGAIEAGMSFLPDNEAIYREWRRIIVQHAVSGVQVYDARLVATVLVYGIRHILTLNVTDFSRYQGLIAIHPNNI